MKTDGNSWEITAETKTHVVLAGPWWCIALLYCYVLIYKNTGVDIIYALLLMCTVAMLWHIWILGFKISVSKNQFSYRDGLYKTTTLDINQIQSIKSAWIKTNYGFKVIELPRFVVKAKDGKRILINQQPFGIGDFHKLLEIVESLQERLPTEGNVLGLQALEAD